MNDPSDSGNQQAAPVVPLSEASAAAAAAPAGAVTEAPPLDEAAAAEVAAAGVPDEPAPSAPAAPDEEPSLAGVDPAAAPAKVRSIVESLLFAADRPVTIKQLKEVLGERDGNVVRAALAAVRAAESAERGLVLHEVAGGFQLRTHPDNAPWVARMLQARPVRLTRASLECLAIVSYRQPVTRADVEDVRGVDSGGVLKLLLDRNLIRILGKKEEPGRPLLYGTTREFLTFFNLRDLRDLPTLRDFSELSEEHRLKVESLHGAPPEAPPEGSPAPTPLAPGGRPHLTLVPETPPAPDESPDDTPGETPDETPVDATAVDLAQAARAVEERAATAAAERGASPQHEDEAARTARLSRSREHAEVDDKLVDELEVALRQAERIRREIDPPKPRAPRVPTAAPLDGTAPAADGAAPLDGATIAGDTETAAEAGLLEGDESPADDEDPPPVC